MTSPVETNTPVQPLFTWPEGVTADEQLAEHGGMVPYSKTGALIPAGTTDSVTVDVITDPSFDVQAVLVVDIATITDGDTLTVTFNGKSPSGHVYAVLDGSALDSEGITTYRIGTGFTDVDHLSANDSLPADLQVVCTVAGSGTIAYGVDLIIGQ